MKPHREKRLKPTGLLFISILAVTYSFAEGAQKPLTLREAINFALESSPLMDSAKKTRSIRDLEYKSSVAKMLPSLDFATTNGIQNYIPFSSTTTLLTPNPTDPWYSTLSLGITENLYDNGASLTNSKIADLKRRLESINYLKARDDLVLNITEEFYRYSLAIILLDVRKQQQAILDKQFKTLANQYHQGFKTKSDFLRLKTQVQQAEIDQTIAENSIALSLNELHRLVGSNLNDNVSLSFEAVPVRQDQKYIFPKTPPAFENIYDSKITKIQQNINEKSVDLVQRNYWPQALVTSGVTYENSSYINSGQPFNAGNQLSWTALLTLQYNIWDWGTRKRDLEVAEYNRDIQQDSLNQNLQDAKSKIANLMADLLRIDRNFSLGQELITLEEESHRNMETQYREGKVSYLDFITSLNDLLSARVQFYTVYFDALQNMAKYRYYEGTIYENTVEK